MDLNDVELMESLPTGVIIDNNIKDLDKFGYSFALSGIDVETCVTFACAKEVVRFSPVKIVIAEKSFVGGTIADVVDLARSSEKHFKIVLWTDRRDHLTDDLLLKVGIAGLIYKDWPFEKMLKKVKDILNSK